MQLVYTPRSHFSRKVRILIDALGMDVELVDAGNVADADPRLFGGNPLMKVPTLVDGEDWLIDSDHIASYLVRRFDPDDRFGVLTQDTGLLNARAVMNGVMAAEVGLILAERSGMSTQGQPRFDKLRASIRAGLSWLEDHAEILPDAPHYVGFHLVCMVDHLAFYKTCPLEYPELRARVGRVSKLPYVAISAFA